MMIISLTTIIAGAAVVLLAVLGSLINPFLRSLRLNKEEEQSAEETTEDAAASLPLPPVTILITAHDNLPELERNLHTFLEQKYPADYQVVVVCQSSDGETIDFLKRQSSANPHL